MKKLLYILTGSVLSIGLVVVLFAFSNAITHKRNGFIRYFSDKAIEVKSMDLGYNSYYFAGYNSGKIFLGNYTVPLLLTSLDTLLSSKKAVAIKKQGPAPYQSMQMRIEGDNVFLVDGTLPAIYKGSIAHKKISGIWKGNVPFSHAVLVDSTHIAYISSDTINGESLLAELDFGNHPKETFAKGLLQKQIDGLFDSDGMLHYDPISKQAVFVYRYRNQFIVTDDKLRLKYRGKTIDTISKAQIKLGHIASRRETKMAAPPLTVNQNSTTYGNLLFVHSGLIGRFEDQKMWDQASIIDVYDLAKNTYISSFYIYDVEGEKLRSFFVRDNCVYFLFQSLECPEFALRYIRLFFTQPFF
jgi:hypothetical protein